MVNEQLTEWIAATFLIILAMKLPFLCLSAGPQEAQAEQWSPKAARELGAGTKSPEPLAEHWQALALLQERLVCVTGSLQVWQQRALCKACHPLYIISSLSTVPEEAKFCSFSRSLPGFLLLFTPSWERCALVTLLSGARVSWLCWEALGQSCCS